MQLEVGPMQNFCYVVYSRKECAVIDPGWDSSRIKELIKKEGLCLKYVILTHSHYDHAQEAHSFQGAKLVAYEGCPVKCGIYVNEGSELKLGDAKINFIHTPGHRPESMCVLVGKNLFTGDTLFIGSTGRTDLEGGSPEEMKKSLRKLSLLPKDTIVWPGHDYGSKKRSTIGEQLKENPHFFL